MDTNPTAGAKQKPVGSIATVSVRSVSKVYGDVQALEDVSFDVGAGEALALWGANGSGKTTLLKAILGLIKVDGAIVVGGHDVRRAGKAARSVIGYVPQETIFYDLGVDATMRFFARLRHTDTERIDALLERLGLADHADKPVPALSGGLKQRLALAVALLADPPVLLLDEPTANLDVQARHDYLTLLADLHHEGKTIVFASHRLDEVEGLADRVLVLEDGKVLDTITPEALRERSAPEVKMTLWVLEAHRARALTYLRQEGIAASLNGRGTVIVQVPSDQKMQLLYSLNQWDIPVLNFEVE
ncbi:MAG: ABC transporter ATP-binding protein [Anaerolineae bacterium]